MGRAPCCEKVGLKKGRWTTEEDETLSKYIEANGEGSWRSLPKNAGLKRCGKSCRLRWINYLRADVKRGNITTEEEDTIIKMHNSLGNRWSLIAGHLQGRTDNEIKNYWNSHLSRRLHTIRRPSGEDPPTIVMDLAKIGGGCKRKGRTSRAAMKKNNRNNNDSNSNNNNKTLSSKEVLTEKSEGESCESGLIDPMPLQEESMRNDVELLEGLERKGMILDTDMWVEKRHVPAQGLILDGGSRSLLSEEIESSERTCLNGDSEKGILGPCDGLETSMLFCDDIMGDGVLMIPSGNSVVSEEKENGASSFSEGEMGLVMSSTKGTSSEERGSGGMSSNGESGEWYSSGSISSCFQDSDWVNWNWDGVVEGPNLSHEGEELLSWLWDSDNGEVGKMVEFEQEKALSAWLLS
ncbi:hypothetical protein IFM89_033448 [Coptis chinensis]|uniref:Uncharacterized protein n=1 Tax=Coptis chinensis TaxID=261450 RepID=A0A835M1G2_9MAGN|nr:hypothetical protein IFM89_033448 [Coptis chinensis]